MIQELGINITAQGAGTAATAFKEVAAALNNLREAAVGANKVLKTLEIKLSFDIKGKAAEFSLLADAMNKFGGQSSSAINRLNRELKELKRLLNDVHAPKSFGGGGGGTQTNPRHCLLR